MIRSINIKNFKCFENLEVEECRRINVIVGDNATGKTALLEAMFFALGTTPELGLRFRQQRGLEASFNGPLRRIDEAIWRDYFFEGDWKRVISIELAGEGAEARSVRIERGGSQLTIPLADDDGDDSTQAATAPITIVWRDFQGKEHSSYPRVTKTGLRFEGGDEDMPDFFFFPANHTISSIENAGRFSTLSLAKRDREFVRLLAEEYDWIEDLSIEVVAGSPAIYATLRGQKDKLPLANVSGGINRMVGVMLGIASARNSIVLVDEIENGIYYKHHVGFWRALLSFTRSYGSQLFVATHSEEWLEAAVDAIADDCDDIALWRIERSGVHPTVRQFAGKQVVAGIRAGEVR